MDEVIEVIEHNESGYVGRTRECFNRGDLTVLIVRDENSGGSRLVRSMGDSTKKPIFEFKLSGTNLTDGTLDRLVDALATVQPKMINFAGNGLGTLNKSAANAVSQSVLDKHLDKIFTAVFKDEKLAGMNFTVVSGGQTGIDEAALKAAAKHLGKALCIAPKDFIYQDISNKTQKGKDSFLSRFAGIKIQDSGKLAPSLDKNKTQQKKVSRESFLEQNKTFFREEAALFSSMNLNKILAAAGWLSVNTIQPGYSKWAHKGREVTVKPYGKEFFEGQEFSFKKNPGWSELFKPSDNSLAEKYSSKGGYSSDDSNNRYAQQGSEESRENEASNAARLKALADFRIAAMKAYPEKTKELYDKFPSQYEYFVLGLREQKEAPALDKVSQGVQNSAMQKVENDQRESRELTHEGKLTQFVNSKVSMFRLASILGFKPKEFTGLNHPKAEKEILNQVDAVKLVEKFLPGKLTYNTEELYFTGPSPFAKDGESQIIVHGGKKTFRCEKTNKAGTVIDFVAEVNNSKKQDALSYVADTINYKPEGTDRVYYQKPDGLLSIWKAENKDTGNSLFLFKDYYRDKDDQPVAQITHGKNMALIERELKISEPKEAFKYLNENKASIFLDEVALNSFNELFVNWNLDVNEPGKKANVARQQSIDSAQLSLIK